MLTFERERLAAPQAEDDLEALVEAVGARSGARVLAERAVVLLRGRAETDADHETTVRERVERRRLAGELPRAAAGELADHHAEPYPLGAGGDRRDDHVRIGHGPVVAVGDVIPDEHAVPARALGQLSQRQQQLGVAVLADVGQSNRAAHRAVYSRS